MAGISGVLNIAKGALMAQQKAMEVTSQNITNVNTKGYSRQTVLFESNAPVTTSRIKVGLGVKIDSVVQSVDQFINRSIYQKTATLNQYEAKASVLSNVETIFNETSDQGLSQAMNEFWNAWQDVTNNPGGLPERTTLLEKSEVLSQQFNSMSEDLHQIRANMNTNLRTAVVDLNSLSRKIAGLNEQIVAAESSGTTANDLRDQRNGLIEQVSQWVGNVYLESGNGSLTVMTSDGMTLVDGNQYWELSQDGNDIYWNNIEHDISQRLSGGKIGAWLDIRDETVPQYLANLDELAGTLINEVNTLHLAGHTLSGRNGELFFEDFETAPNTPNSTNFRGAAAYIKLSADVKGAPDQIAVGGQSGNPGDNENAAKILALQTDDTVQIKKWAYEKRGADISSNTETETMDDYYRTLAGEIGIATDEASRTHDFTQAMLDRLGESRDSISGVNLDEEMTELLKEQRAFEAASRLITIADEMLQTLLQVT